VDVTLRCSKRAPNSLFGTASPEDCHKTERALHKEKTGALPDIHIAGRVLSHEAH
jgi:hypothetical protein